MITHQHTEVCTCHLGVNFYNNAKLRAMLSEARLKIFEILKKKHASY